MTYQICLIHPFDVRGSKIGGLETYVRDFITYHPEDVSLLVVGVDGKGDLKLGGLVDLSYRGRSFKFLPILRYADKETHHAARAIHRSITFLFFLALLRYFTKIRRAVRDGIWSAELHRMEYAIFPPLLGMPFIHMLHGDPAPHQQMDTLLKRVWFIQRINEPLVLRLCAKLLCVNPVITDRVRAQYPRYRNKVDTLTTWANPEIFHSKPFRRCDHHFRIVFCGRLDAFKVPPLMFTAVSRLRSKLGELVEFHYVGMSDPNRFAEFDAIRDITIVHGYQDAYGIAAVLADVDVGILTSEFEGMPRFVLETLSVGRPVVALHLPQLEGVIEDGVSGYLVPRLTDFSAQVDSLADSLMMVREDMRDGRLDPDKISLKVSDFRPEPLLGKVYSYHRQIQSIRQQGLSCRSHKFH